MGDASSLRSILSQTNGSADAIQKSAGAMLRHYDKSASVAVTEWRNSLQTGTDDQLLPLLYVANEVLQNSKRNRGNNFLEAFSPVLGQSLQYVCQRVPSLVEKVRRTAKIWGDRRVFSIRFVNDLLQGLEPYREGGSGVAAQKKQAPPPDDRPPFSPLHGEKEPNHPPPQDVPTKKEPESPLLQTDDDDHLDDDETEQQEESQDTFPFESQDSQGMGHLDLDVTIDKKALKLTSKRPSTSNKRRRGSGSSTHAPALVKRNKSNERRKSILSTMSLMELWNQASSLEKSFQLSQGTLNAIAPENFQTDSTKIEQLVGDELSTTYRKLIHAQQTVTKERITLHGIAKDRKALEHEAVRYIPWIRAAMKQDEEDIQFCNGLEEKLNALKMVHADARAARDQRREKETEERERAEEEAQKKQEEEERSRLLESAIKKETVAKPGMVWNRDAQEYQYLNTDESWRD